MKLEYEDSEELFCVKCQVPLAMQKVHITYLQSTFPAELPGCPLCGEVYVSEEIAMGKMLEVEKTLEDK